MCREFILADIYWRLRLLNVVSWKRPKRNRKDYGLMVETARMAGATCGGAAGRANALTMMRREAKARS